MVIKPVASPPRIGSHRRPTPPRARDPVMAKREERGNGVEMGFSPPQWLPHRARKFTPDIENFGGASNLSLVTKAATREIGIRPPPKSYSPERVVGESGDGGMLLFKRIVGHARLRGVTRQRHSKGLLRGPGQAPPRSVPAVRAAMHRGPEGGGTEDGSVKIENPVHL